MEREKHALRATLWGLTPIRRRLGPGRLPVRSSPTPNFGYGRLAKGLGPT